MPAFMQGQPAQGNPQQAPMNNPMQPNSANQQAIETGAMQEPEEDMGMTGMEGAGGDVRAMIDAALGKLSPENKETLAMYLTPEFASLMKDLLGDQIGGFLEEKADPSRILIPMDREKVMSAQSQGQEIPGEVDAVSADATQGTDSSTPQKGMMQSPRPGHVPAGTAPQMA